MAYWDDLEKSMAILNQMTGVDPMNFNVDPTQLMETAQRIADGVNPPISQGDPVYKGQAVVDEAFQAPPPEPVAVNQPEQPPPPDIQTQAQDIAAQMSGAKGHNPFAVDLSQYAQGLSPNQFAQGLLGNSDTNQAQANLQSAIEKFTSKDQPKQNSGADIGNKATEEAVAKNQAQQAEAEARAKAIQADWDAEQARIQQLRDWYGQPPEQQRINMSRPILNGVERGYAQALTQAKGLYDNAEEVAKQWKLRPDQVQKFASDWANHIRSQAEAAGITTVLDGYGSGVTLEDSSNYLQSNDARARVEALNRYGEDSEDVYRRSYNQYLLAGKNTDIASRLAERDARKYQREKIRFKQDMLYTYGIDGGYVNDLGIGLLGHIAEENPALGNFLVQMNGTPKEALERVNKLQDDATEHQNTLETKGYEAYLNEIAARSGLPRDLVKLMLASGLNLRNGLLIGQQSGEYSLAGKRLDIEQRERDRQQRIADQNAKLERGYSILAAFYQNGDITADQYKQGILSLNGIHLSGTSGKDPNEKQRAGIKGVIDITQKRLDGINKRMEEMTKNLLPNQSLSPAQQKEYDELKAQADGLSSKINEFSGLYEGLVIGTPGGADIPELYDPKDMDSNVRAIAQMIGFIKDDPQMMKDAETNLDRMIDRWLSESQIVLSPEEKRTLKERARAYRQSVAAGRHKQ